jgi:hypothetical protein
MRRPKSPGAGLAEDRPRQGGTPPSAVAAVAAVAVVAVAAVAAVAVAVARGEAHREDSVALGR